MYIIKLTFFIILISLYSCSSACLNYEQLKTKHSANLEKLNYDKKLIGEPVTHKAIIKDDNGKFAISKKPKVISKPNKLHFPCEIEKDKIEGEVLVEFTITVQGFPEDIKIIKSPNEILSLATKVAVLEYRYEPAYQGENPVKVRWRLPFRYFYR